MIIVVLALAAAEIPEAQLFTQIESRDVFAPAFRGGWAKTRVECSAEAPIEAFTVTENRITGYEWDSILLKSTPMIYQTGPNGQPAYTVVVLTASRGETEVDFGKARLSLVGEELYMSNAAAVPEDQHFNAEFANVRCP